MVFCRVCNTRVVPYFYRHSCTVAGLPWFSLCTVTLIIVLHWLNSLFIRSNFFKCIYNIAFLSCLTLLVGNSLFCWWHIILSNHVVYILPRIAATSSRRLSLCFDHNHHQTNWVWPGCLEEHVVMAFHYLWLTCTMVKGNFNTEMCNPYNSSPVFHWKAYFRRI